jgi:hypothetical protein
MFDNLKVTTPASNYSFCPAFKDVIKNTFVIKSSYDFKIGWNESGFYVETKRFPQEFFNSVIHPKSEEDGLLSIVSPSLIMFAEDSLEMELLPPYMHKTLNGHFVVPGKFNIGKHFRKLECSIHYYNYDNIQVKEGDPLFYVKFLTDEKITFKRFTMSDTLMRYESYFRTKKHFVNRVIPLKWYYENNIRNAILKEIKNNVVD